MLIILTKKDLGRESKRKPVDKLSTWDDFIKHSDRMPDQNLYEVIQTAETRVFLGKGNKEGYIFALNNRAGTHSKKSTEDIIATVIRQLNHEQEIETDYVKLIKCIAASLTADECRRLSIELEKQAFEKS